MILIGIGIVAYIYIASFFHGVLSEKFGKIGGENPHTFFGTLLWPGTLAIMIGVALAKRPLIRVFSTLRAVSDLGGSVVRWRAARRIRVTENAKLPSARIVDR